MRDQSLHSPLSEEAALIAKLLKVEALYARPGSEGERHAAKNARDRILERLAEFEAEEEVVEYQFSLGDRWKKALFLALARRYGLEPYRYSRQRRTTAMLRTTKSFIDEVLMPEFNAFNKLLTQHLDDVTQRIIAKAIHENTDDASEANGRLPAE